MQFVSAHDYTGERAWDALDLVTFDQPATVRLHWTNEPYVWHVNDGEEVFVGPRRRGRHALPRPRRRENPSDARR